MGSGVPVVVVAHAVDSVVDVAVLEVGEGAELAAERHICASIDVGVEFVAGVVVVLLERVDGAEVVAHPFDLSEMAAVEVVHASAEHGFERPRV